MLCKVLFFQFFNVQTFIACLTISRKYLKWKIACLKTWHFSVINLGSNSSRHSWHFWDQDNFFTIYIILFDIIFWIIFKCHTILFKLGIEILHCASVPTCFIETTNFFTLSSACHCKSCQIHCLLFLPLKQCLSNKDQFFWDQFFWDQYFRVQIFWDQILWDKIF